MPEAVAALDLAAERHVVSPTLLPQVLLKKLKQERAESCHFLRVSLLALPQTRIKEVYKPIGLSLVVSSSASCSMSGTLRHRCLAGKLPRASRRTKSQERALSANGDRREKCLGCQPSALAVFSLKEVEAPEMSSGGMGGKREIVVTSPKLKGEVGDVLAFQAVDRVDDMASNLAGKDTDKEPSGQATGTTVVPMGGLEYLKPADRLVVAASKAKNFHLVLTSVISVVLKSAACLLQRRANSFTLSTMFPAATLHCILHTFVTASRMAEADRAKGESRWPMSEEKHGLTRTLRMNMPIRETAWQVLFMD